MMISQPSIDIATNVEASASFDPPVVVPGQKSVYRVTFNALADSIRWPDKLNAPPELDARLSARGQTLVPGAAKLEPKTSINYHVRASGPGSYRIAEFPVEVYGHEVLVPAASLHVVNGPGAGQLGTAGLKLDPAETNVYAGQSVILRVLAPATSGNVVQGMDQVQFNGDGFLTDTAVARQRIGPIDQNGQPVLAYIYEAAIIPLKVGDLTISAQGFSIGNRFTGTIVIQGQAVIPGGAAQNVLLDSDPITLHVKPLPSAGQLPGFTGAIGSFTLDTPHLSTNRLRVGDVLKLVVTFRGENNLARLVAPPPPASALWRVFPAVPGAAFPVTPIPSAARPSTFTYTLIPLTSGLRATPAIPFSYFDPGKAAYVDLTIPPVPIEVIGGSASAEAQRLAGTDFALRAGETNLTLSGLAERPGLSASSLVPWQQRAGFWLLQLAPLPVFVGLWSWDRRRRFLEAHPDLVRRRHARRALRRVRRALAKAASAGDAPRYLAEAIEGLRVAAAPHFPAEPDAIVCRDVLEVLGDRTAESSSGQIVGKFFALADASRFSVRGAQPNGLLALNAELSRVLQDLEAKL